MSTVVQTLTQNRRNTHTCRIHSIKHTAHTESHSVKHTQSFVEVYFLYCTVAEFSQCYTVGGTRMASFGAPFELKTANRVHVLVSV